MTKVRGFQFRLPESIRDEAVAAAKADGICLSYFISLALSEKITRVAMEASSPRPALQTSATRYLTRRAA